MGLKTSRAKWFTQKHLKQFNHLYPARAGAPPRVAYLSGSTRLCARLICLREAAMVLSTRANIRTTLKIEA